MQAAQTSVTWSGRTKTPIRWANFGLVDSPPPTHEVVAGLAVGVHDADEGDVVDLGLGAVVDAAGHRGLPLARQVAELRAAHVLRDRLGEDVAGVDDLVLEDARPAGSRA